MRASLLLPLALVGCVSTVRPPVNVVDPVDVALVQDARHLGVLLPRKDGGYVEFGFGDWDWYVAMNDAWYDVFDTVLLPTPGALGREIRPQADLPAVSRRHPWWDVHALTVSRAAVETLRDELEARFDVGRPALLRNERYGFDFVPAGTSYWLPNNCADVAADWLRTLGCSVTPAPVRIGLHVPDSDPSQPGRAR